MKKLTMMAALLLSANLFAQQNPTGPAINPNAPVPQLAGHAWYRGGNNLGGIGGAKNIFGTMWNSPIYTYTAGVARMTLNGFTINCFTLQPSMGCILYKSFVL